MKVTKENITEEFTEYELQAIIHELFREYGKIDIVETEYILENVDDGYNTLCLLNDIANFKGKTEDVFDCEFVCFDYESNELTGDDFILNLFDTETWIRNIIFFDEESSAYDSLSEELHEKVKLFIDNYNIR